MSPLPLWIAALLKRGAAVLEPRNSRHSLLVLLFHRVLREPDPLLPEEPDVAAFIAQIETIRSICTVLPFGEAVERLYARALPSNAACITFDDGYANCLTCAVPVLEARGLPATVFVATGFLGDRGMWNDTVIESVRRAGEELDLSSIGLGRFDLPDLAARRRTAETVMKAIKYLPPLKREEAAWRIAAIVDRELPTHLMLSEAQIKELARRGVEVGAHTVSHPILTQVDDATARREIETSKATLEDITGSPVRFFAYPNGHPLQDYHRSHVGMVRNAGFTAAVSTAWGACHPGSDRFQLPRLRPWDSSAMRFAGRLLHARRAQQEAKA